MILQTNLQCVDDRGYRERARRESNLNDSEIAYYFVRFDSYATPATADNNNNCNGYCAKFPTPRVANVFGNRRQTRTDPTCEKAILFEQPRTLRSCHIFCTARGTFAFRISSEAIISWLSNFRCY